MNYMVLRDPVGSDVNFPSWQNVGFAATEKGAMSLAKRPKVPFQRGDIFVIIKTKFASDIIRNIAGTYIAISDQKIENVTVLPEFNWYDLYQNRITTGIFGVISHYLTSRMAVLLAYGWVTQCASPISLDHPILQSMLQRIKEWIELNVATGKSLKSIYGLKEKLLGINHGNYKARDAVLNILSMILTSGMISASDFRSEIYNSYNLVYESYPLGPTGGRNVASVKKMREILLSLAPMREVMIAAGTGKQLDIQVRAE